MLPLNNELEHIQIILHPKFERKRIRGGDFIALCVGRHVGEHNHILVT